MLDNNTAKDLVQVITEETDEGTQVAVWVDNATGVGVFCIGPPEMPETQIAAICNAMLASGLANAMANTIAMMYKMPKREM
jgi:hypothetical protein